MLSTHFFVFIVIYIHSFNFFIALAAPVPSTPETPSVLRKRKAQYDNDLYIRHNGRRDGKISVLDRDLASSYLTGLDPTESRFTSPPALQTLAHRSIFSKIGHAFKKVGGAIKQGFKKAGNGIKQAVHKVGSGVKNAANGIKKVAQKVGHGVKKVAQKVGNGVKTAAKAVGHGVKKAGKWIKANGPKIAKGYLKVLATAASVAGRVANFVPGIGKPLSKGLKFASAGLDKGSNAIKANLGGFGKAMSIMDKIQHPLGGVGGQVLEAVLKRDVDEVLRRDPVRFVKERELDLLF